jgi:hypothetical protein
MKLKAALALAAEDQEFRPPAMAGGLQRRPAPSAGNKLDMAASDMALEHAEGAAGLAMAQSATPVPTGKASPKF